MSSRNSGQSTSLSSPSVILNSDTLLEQKKIHCSSLYSMFAFEKFCKGSKICFDDNADLDYKVFLERVGPKKESIEVLNSFVDNFKLRSNDFFSSCDQASITEFKRVKKIADNILKPSFSSLVKKRFYDFIDFCREDDLLSCWIRWSSSEARVILFRDFMRYPQVLRR